MKPKQQFISTAILVCLTSMAYSQASVPGNVRPFIPPRFLGWNTAGAPGSLEIRNDFNQPINIYTNGSQRMSIRPNGRVGINSANPLSLSI